MYLSDVSSQVTGSRLDHVAHAATSRYHSAFPSPEVEPQLFLVYKAEVTSLAHDTSLSIHLEQWNPAGEDCVFTSIQSREIPRLTTGVGTHTHITVASLRPAVEVFGGDQRQRSQTVSNLPISGFFVGSIRSFVDDRL